MNRKRLCCLLLAALLGLLPLAPALAAGEKYVKNTGTEPVAVFAAIGDETPVETLAPGAQVKWLGENTVDGQLWYQVEGGFVAAGPTVTVVEAPQPTPKPTDPPAPTDPPKPTDPPVNPTDPPVNPTDPPVNPTDPPVNPTDPPVNPTDPPVNPTDPPVDPTDPPVNPTDPPVDPTDPPVNPTDPPVNPTDPPGPTPSASDQPGPTPSATASGAPSASPSPTPTPTPTPRPGGASDTELVIDTAYIYPGMTKSYSSGYMPTVSGGKALFVLPLLGEVMGDVLRVTPDMDTVGPFLYGNYQFDLKKTRETAKDAAGNPVERDVFLMTLSLDLAVNRQNGTYPVTFRVSYTDKHGDPAEQDFTLQVAITDGESPAEESGGGGGWSGGWSGPSVVRKPVLVLTNSEVSTATIAGGQGFTLSLTVQNVGDLEAKNVRIMAAADGQGVYRSDSLAPVFLARMAVSESTETSFPFASDKTVFAGRHGLTVTLAYEDAYGNVYADTVPLQINVVQTASIGFDEMKLPETLTSGETFTQPVCVYNTGYAPVYNVRCTLRMDGLIAASAFLGTLEPQQSADKAVSVFVTTLSGKEKYGESYGELVISYEDMAGEEHTEYQQLRTTVQAPVEITDEEKAKKEKEQKEQQTLSQWWVSLLVAIAFILIVLSVIVIARFSRMLKMK